MRAGQTGNALLGGGLIAMGRLVWFDLDKVIDAALLDRLASSRRQIGLPLRSQPASTS